MQRQQTKYYLAEMSEALGVSRSGYYRWAEAKVSARREQDELIKPVIAQVVRLAHGAYGYRPVHQHRREQGVDCGRDRTLRLMRELDLVGRAHTRFKPIGTDSEHLLGYHPNPMKNQLVTSSPPRNSDSEPSKRRDLLEVTGHRSPGASFRRMNNGHQNGHQNVILEHVEVLEV